MSGTKKKNGDLRGKTGKSPLHHFKVGNDGGPGRPRGSGAPADQKAAWQQVLASRSRIRHDWQTYYEELHQLPFSELQALVGHKKNNGEIVSSDPHAPVLKLMVARSILYAMRTGRAYELQVHKELMCGPEPKRVELSDPNGAPLSPLANYSPEQLAIVYVRVGAILQEAECKSTPTPLSPSLPQSSVPSAEPLPPPSDTA